MPSQSLLIAYRLTPCLALLWAATAMAQSADLSITVSDGVTQAVPGEDLTYAVVVRNVNGPDDVNGAIVQDTFPEVLDCRWTCQGVGGASCTPGQVAGNINDTVILPRGGTLTYSAVCDIDADAAAVTSTLSNTATVTAPPGIGDPNIGNNSSSDLDTELEPRADLTLSKTDGVTHAVPGQDTLTYQLIARNPSGPSDISGATLNDVFEDDLSCLWTCVASGGATCTPGQVAGDINDTLNLPVGGRATYTALCDIDPLATGTIQNTAALNTPDGVTDPNNGNNVASDLDTELTPRTDIAVTVSDGVEQATPGETVTYTVNVQHQGGPSGVTGAVVQDVFPAPLSCSWSCIAVGGATCNGGPMSGDLIDNITLPVGGRAVYTAVCDIDPQATGTLTNTATVTVPSGVVDTNGGNNLDTDDDTQLIPRVDLAVQVSNGAATVVPGETVTYTVTASNPALLFALGPDSQDMALFRLDPFRAVARRIGTLGLPDHGLAACRRLVLDVDGSLWAACVTPFETVQWWTVSTVDGRLQRRGGAPQGTFDAATSPRDATWPGGATYTLVNDGATTFLGSLDTRTRQARVLGDTGALLSLLASPATSQDELGNAVGIGSENVDGALIESVVPADLACTWTCTPSGGAACNAGPVAGDLNDSVDLPVAATAIYTAVCDVDPAARGSLSLTATLTPPDDVEEVDAADNSDTDTDSLTPISDVSIAKTDGVTGAVAGTAVTYTITARNDDGPSDASGALVQDVFSDDLSCLWSCIPSGGASCTQGQVAGHINDTVELPVGSLVTYTAQCDIAAAADGTLSNTATVTADGDPNLVDNSASDLDTELRAVADLTIGKTDGVSQAIPGQTVTYSIVAANPVGPSDIVGAVVQDTFADALSCTWTCTPSGGAACTAGPLTGDIHDGVHLPVGSSVQYAAVCDIAPDATGTLSNTAAVTLPVGSSDPNGANNSAADLDTVLRPQADVSISKDNGQTEVVVGDNLIYTVAVANAGPSAASGVQVTDSLPPELTCLWTCLPDDGADCTAGPVEGDLDDLVNLPAATAVTYSGDCTVSAAASGVLSNIASVQIPAQLHDPEMGNNSATDTDDLIFEADLTLTKTDGVTEVVAGTSLTYTLVASNEGPSPVIGAQLSDTFAPSLNCVWSCVPSGGAVCTAGPVSGDILTSLDLPAAASATYTAQCDVDSAATGVLSNTATLTAPDTVTELDPGNNTATDDDTEVLVVADLSLSKTDNVTEATPGLDVTYVITARNEAGPSDMPGARVRDTFADSLDCTWTCAAAGGGSCGAGSGDIDQTVDLPVGGSATFTATCGIAADAEGFLVNTATVSTAPDTDDPDPADNSATDDDTELIPMADLDVIKSDGVGTVVAGTASVYSIQVRNPAGPSNVRDVAVSDTFPQGLSCQWTCIAAAGAQCTAGPRQGNIDDTVDLPIGGNITYTAVCQVASSATGVLVNTATAAVPRGGTFIDSDSTTVLLQADVEVSKTDGTDTATPGSSTTYAIVVENEGPSDVRNATVLDIPPPGMSCTWSCEPTGGALCDPQPTGNLVDIIDLPAGATAAYTAQCTIPPRAVGFITNRVRVELPDDVTELDPSDNQASDTNRLVPVHDLAIDKSATAASVAPGDTLTYILEVSNDGPSDAQGVIVRDVLPTSVVILETQVVGASPGPFLFADGFESGNTVNWGHGLDIGQCGPVESAEGPSIRCRIGTVTPGATPKVIIETQVSDTADGTLINTGRVESFTLDVTPGNNVDTAVTPLDDPEPFTDTLVSLDYRGSDTLGPRDGSPTGARSIAGEGDDEVVEVPTLGTWGLMVLCLMLAVVGALRLRRRRPGASSRDVRGVVVK